MDITRDFSQAFRSMLGGSLDEYGDEALDFEDMMLFDLDEFMVEKAAYQIEMAGSVDPVALAGVASMNTIWGPGLTVEQILQAVEDYPGVASGFDINANSEDLEDADGLYNNPTYKQVADDMQSRLDEAKLSTYDVALSPQLDSLADVLFDGAESGGDQFTETGDVLSTNITDSIINVMSSQKAVSMLENQAATQEATTGTVSATTVAQINKAKDNIEKNEPTSNLYKIYKSNPQGFENFITNEANYTQGFIPNPQGGGTINVNMTPDTVNAFLSELGEYAGLGVAEPLKVAQEAFFAEWNPMGGYLTDPNWTPPAYFDEQTQNLFMEQHQANFLQATDDRTGQQIRRIAATQGDFEAFKLDPSQNEFTLPVGANGTQMGTAGFVPDFGLPANSRQEQLRNHDLIMAYKKEQGFDKESMDALMEEDPEFGMGAAMGYQGDTEAISDSMRKRQAQLEGLSLSEKLLGDQVYMGSVPDEGISPEDVQLYGGQIDEPGATDIDYRQFGAQGVTDADIDYETLPESKVITDEQGNQRTVLVDPKTQEIISEGPMQGQIPPGETAPGQVVPGQPSTGGTMTAPFGAFSTEAGIDPSEFFTPEQQFLQYAQRATAPGSPMRRAFYGLQNPLMQQYYLTGRGTDPRYGGAPEFQSFGDFAAQYQRGGIDNQQIRGLAEEAAKIASMSGDEYFDYKYAPGNTDFQQQRIETIRERYKNPEDRQNLARFLATQRQGGGVYGGLIGQTLGSSIDEMANVYASKFPTGGESRNFLNYFMQQTGKKPNGQTTNGV